jgi:hypothetical protein
MMKGPRAQGSLCEMMRPMKPVSSTVRGECCARGRVGGTYICRR